MIAAALCLVGCQPAQAPEEALPVTTEAGVAAPPPMLQDLPAATVASTPASTPLPAVEASDDQFVGWYFERDSVGLLQACGQAAPLQVADPTFLRQLKAKLGGASQPVYVRLRVRLAAGSRLEITEVQQFGVDEIPVQDCVLVKPVG